MNKKYWLFGIIIIAIIVGGLFLIKDKSGESLGASIFGITRTTSMQAKPAVPLTPETLVVTQTETKTTAAPTVITPSVQQSASPSAVPVPAPAPVPPPAPCALNISALPTPASQTVPVGTNNFAFARIRFAAPSTCSITLNKVVVGVQNNGGSISGMIQNLKAFNNFNVQVGNTIASPTSANIIGSNLGIVIPANGSAVLTFRANVVGVGTGTIRLGESYTEAVKTGTTQQVGNGNQYWGAWMTIFSPACNTGTICYMPGYGHLVYSFNTNANAWFQLPNAPWASRYGQQSVIFNNKIWVMGGLSGSGIALNDVWSSPDGITWTQVLANAPWSGRTDFQAAVFNNKIWVMGGNNNAVSQCSSNVNWAGCADVWSSPDGITWTQVTASAPWGARWAFESVVFNNKLWVLGNNTALGCNGMCTDVWSSPDGITWTQTTAPAPWGSWRNYFSAMVFNNKIWVTGGAGDNGSYYDDVWSSPDGITWTQVTANVPWPGRAGFGSVVINNKMWIMGGSNGTGLLHDMWSSSNGVTWTQVTTNIPWVMSFDGIAVTP